MFHEYGATQITTLQTYQSEAETQEIFLCEDVPSVTDWMLALHNLKTNKITSVTITPPLSWIDANELELRALEHETTNLSTTLGYDLRLDSSPQIFPPQLSSFVLQNISGDLEKVPAVNAVISPPSITSTIQGFRLIENAQPTLSAETIAIPLLAHWNGNILPSIELAALISRFDASPNDLEIHLGSHIRFSEHAPIIPIDATGRATIPRISLDSDSASFKSLLATKLVLSPESPVVIRHRSDPVHLHQLEHTLAQLSSKLFALPRHISRPSLAFETGFLLLASLIFASRFPYVLIPLAGPAVSAIYANFWILWTPILGTFVISLLLRKMIKPSRSCESSPDETLMPEKATPPIESKKETPNSTPEEHNVLKKKPVPQKQLSKKSPAKKTRKKNIPNQRPRKRKKKR